MVGSAIDVALVSVEERQLLSGYNIEYIVKDTWCKPNHGELL